jgi:PAS domain S-box-containing protein
MSTARPLWWSKPPATLRYGIAVLSVAAVHVVVLLLSALLDSTPAISLFLCAIMFVAWFGGVGPGLVATALSVLAFDYYFMPPINSLVLLSKDIPRIVLFAIAALFVASLSAAQRRTAEALRGTRDDLQIAVHDLSSVNKTLQEENAERQRIGRQLRQAERELRVTIDTIPTLAWHARPDGFAAYLNKRWLDYTGLALEDALGWAWQAAVHPDDRAELADRWRAILAAGVAAEAEARLRRFDGEYRWFLFRAAPFRDDRGELVGWYGTNTDIEDRKRAEQSLRRAESELRTTIDTIPALVLSAWPDGTPDFINARWIEQGFSEHDLRSGLAAVVHPDDLAEIDEKRSRSLATGEPYQAEARLRRANGEYRWYLAHAVTLRDETGRVVKRYAMATDIEDRKRAEESLRRAEQELRTTIDTIPVGAASFQADGTPEFYNQSWRTYTGLSLEELRAHPWRVTVHPDEVALVEREWRVHLATGEPFEMEQRERRADGEYRWHLIRRVPLRDEVGEVTRWYGAGYDIEDQKRAEGALRRSQAYLDEAQRLSQTGSFAWRIASGEIVWSKEAYRILGFDQAVKPTIDLILQRAHPDDRDLLQHEIDRAAQGEQDYDYEHRFLTPAGVLKHLHVSARRVSYGPDEEEIIGAVMDVTATRHAQEALNKAQTELARVTRMTTLGEMSASIAHEVNQPLAAIITNGGASLHWLTREAPETDEAVAAIRRIVSEANRASEVIRRIRELARKADPEVTQLDINEVIAEVVALVKREALSHRVTLQLQLASGLRWCAAIGSSCSR